MDRAGLVGADGPTHCGSFDVTFMACLPNMIVMAPSDEAELFHMVATAAAIDDRPSCFRYPRGNGIGIELPPGNKGVPLEVSLNLTNSITLIFFGILTRFITFYCPNANEGFPLYGSYVRNFIFVCYNRQVVSD